MPTRTSPWPPGTPCWADVPMPDRSAAEAFYRAVVGWEFEAPDPSMGGYANALVDGVRAVGSMTPMGDDQPVAWTLYFATADADATAAAVEANGGTVRAPPMDVPPDLGRMAIAADPTGAVFGLWQAGSHPGTGVFGQPGAIAWEDLRSTDPAAATAFYRAVFGVEVHPLDMAGPDYGEFHLPGDDAPLGGIGGMMGGVIGGAGGSHWLVYFAVGDVDAALEQVEAQGGSVTAPAFDSPYGRMATVTDPAGAPFVIIAPSGPQPERSG